MIVITPWPHRAGWGSHFLIGVYLLAKAEQEYPKHVYHLKSNLPLYDSTWNDVYVQPSPTGTHASALSMIQSPDNLIYKNHTFFDLVAFEHALPARRGLPQSIVERYRPIAQRLVLQPSVAKTIDALCTSFPVHASIGVYFRGTDKHQEVGRPEWESYHRILKEYPTGKLLVQSDEQSFVDMMKQTYGQRVWTLPGATYSTGKPIHIDAKAPKDNLNEIVMIIYVLARCKTLIGNVSNVTHSANLLRTDTVIYV